MDIQNRESASTLFTPRDVRATAPILSQLDEKALQIYKRITSFDAIVDKALGKFNKRNKQISTFRKPNKNYSFIREPSFDNILLFLYKSGFLSIQDLYKLNNVHPL